MPPQVQDLAQIMATLDPAYTQTREIFNKQLSAIPGQQAAQMQGIETDKNNAFSGIAKSANSRGLDFWGIPLEEQSKYLGGTYLKSKNDVTAATTQQQTALQTALAQLYQDQYTKAIGTQEGQRSAYNSYQENERSRAFTARENAANRAASASQSSAASGPTVSYVRNKSGGYDLINNDGTRNNTLDLASYVKLNGGGVSDLLNFLSEGDAQDKKAVANYYNNTKRGMTPQQAMAQLQKDRPTAFYKGGKL